MSKAKKKTQAQRIAEHLFKYGSITRAVVEDFRRPIKRLSARIGELKAHVYIGSKLIPWGTARQSKYSVTQSARLELKRCLDEGEI